MPHPFLREIQFNAVVQHFHARSSKKVHELFLETDCSRRLCLEVSRKLSKQVACKLYPGARVTVRVLDHWDFRKAQRKSFLQAVESLDCTDWKETVQQASGASVPDIGDGFRQEETDCSAACVRGCIRICTKKNCCRKGGRRLWCMLEESLSRCGLQNAIALKPSGCLGQCKQGPCMMCLPGNKVVGAMDGKDLTRWILSHFQPRVEPR